MTEFRYVGRSRPVHDAVQKATGELRYGGDLTVPGMLHAKLVLSPHAHAVVSRVDATRAMAVPGVIGVFSHHDAPATPYNRYRIVPNQVGCPDDETIFAATARFVGDRVAAVVARSQEAAEAAARVVDVEYTPLTPMLTALDALQPGAPRIHPAGNLVHEFVHDDGAESAPAPVDTVTVVTEVSTQMLHHAALEAHMCLANFDAGGKLTIHTPCQSVYGARTVVADLLGLAYNKVRVVKVPMGGSFGGKQEFILEPIVAYLAMRVRRPVRLVLNRQECIAATMVRPQQTSRLRTAATPGGRIIDIDIDTLLAAGGYAGSSPDYTESMAHKITRLYRTSHYRHRGRVAYTNTPMAGGLRGWGAPDINTCMEIHLDQVAARLGLDPVTLRMQNLVQPYDHDPVGGRSLGDARVRECLAEAADAFGWAERVARPTGTGRYRRAVGMACGGHKNGILGKTFADTSTLTLKMNEDGCVDLNVSLHEMGAGTGTTMQMVIAEELGIDPDLISVGEADSEVTPFDFGCFGSRMTYVVGAGARLVAQQLKVKLADVAAELLEAAADDVVVADGRAEVRGMPGSGLTYGQVVHGARVRHGHDVTVTTTYRPTTNPGSYSAQFAEVEVDVLTGAVRVTDFLVAVDIGLAINPAMVEGQCIGAVQAGIGAALCEEVQLDAHGRPLDGGFKNYHVVLMPEMPPVRVLMIEHPDADEGPFGAKSVGEIAFVPTAAAVVNAVNRALGTSITTLPLSPERIVSAVSTRFELAGASA